MAAAIILLMNSFILAFLAANIRAVVETITRWIVVIDLLLVLVYLHVAFQMVRVLPAKLSPAQLPGVSFVWYLLFFLNGILVSLSVILIFKCRKFGFPFFLFALLTCLYQLLVGYIVYAIANY